MKWIARFLAIGLIVEIIFILSIGLHAAVVTIPSYPDQPDNRKAHIENEKAHFENDSHPPQTLQPLWILEGSESPFPTERPTEDKPDGEVFTVTGYCKCIVCCGVWSAEHPSRGADYEQMTASGTTPTAGRTCGADWSVLPAGAIIKIEGVGERIVEDKGAAWISDRYASRYIDLYFDSHEEARSFGKRELLVEVVGD